VLTFRNANGNFATERNYKIPELNIELLQKYYLNDMRLARRMNSVSFMEEFSRKKNEEQHNKDDKNINKD
jgi:hypothetical protein